MYDHSSSVPQLQPATHSVLIFVHGAESEFAVAACQELFDVANALTGSQIYKYIVRYGLRDLEDFPSTDQRQSIILFGNTNRRWKVDAHTTGMLCKKLSRFQKIALVGGAAFICTTAPLLHHLNLVIHSNLGHTAGEVGLQIPP